LEAINIDRKKPSDVGIYLQSKHFHACHGCLCLEKIEVRISLACHVQKDDEKSPREGNIE